jgi:hypothetical protein
MMGRLDSSHFGADQVPESPSSAAHADGYRFADFLSTHIRFPVEQQNMFRFI